MRRLGRLLLAFAIHVQRALADLLDTKLSCVASEKDIRRIIEHQRPTLAPRDHTAKSPPRPSGLVRLH